MSRSGLLFRGLAVTGATAAAVVTARRAAAERAAEEFYRLPLELTAAKWHGAGYGGTPVYFHQCEGITTFHGASFDAVSKILPSDDLYPVRLPDGRAVVSIGAMQYGDITAQGVDGNAALPYGEVMIAAMVTRRPAPPFVPLMLSGTLPVGAGTFVLHLPVTTRVARDVGRLAWGYPKFVADMDFETAPVRTVVHLSEGGHEILTRKASIGGRASVARGSMALYSVLNEQLIELDAPIYGLKQMAWGSHGGVVSLGDHPVADELRRLEIAPAPFVTLRMLYRFVMTAGKPIGPARPYSGYIGQERDLGRYVVRYPNAAPIDRYAPYADTAGPAKVVREMTPPREPVAVG